MMRKSVWIAILALCAASAARAQNQQPQLKMIRGAQVVGASLYNDKGAHIGNIKDVMFDEDAGGLTHVVLSAGAFPGMGDILPPAPWYTIAVQEKADGKLRFVSDSGKWPSSKTEEIVGRKGKKIVDLTDVQGSKLLDRNQHKIGQIKDVVMDGSTGLVVYAIVHFDRDYVDKGDKLTAVPWKLVRQSTSDKTGYVLNADKSQVQNVSYFSPNHWPNFNQLSLDKQIYQHYHVQPDLWRS